MLNHMGPQHISRIRLKRNLNAHRSKLRRLDLSAQADEGDLDERRDELVDVVALALALKDDHFEQLGRVALRVLAGVGLDQHLLAHQVEDCDVVAR